FLPSDQEAGAHQAELRAAIRDGRAEDTRWHRHKSGARFWANGVTMRLRDKPLLLKIMRDETPTKLADDQRILLLNELNHRIKNTLTTVQSIVDQTLRAAAVDGDVRTSLTERLLALSKAHNILVDESWAGADLGAILDSLVAAQAPGRFTLDGPDVRLSATQAVPLSLALHELATNAIKYGALSAGEDGRVRLHWNIALNGQGARHLTFLWEETGGPLVQPPVRQGFGTRLLSRIFAPAGGTVTLAYPPTGVRCAIGLPLSSADELRPFENAGDVRLPT
ncbi:sensor histidine kinase, partial [Phenylobacterium sp.]|uniref:sensor histidine kinase n=1 Tax=Phenylobacterium sp. TaxID=1871053 RepID=UPI00286BAF7F